MSVRTLLQADLRQTGRSWRLRGLGAAFVFFFMGTAGIFTALGRLPGGASEPGSYATALVSPMGLLFPVVGVLIGYRAIVGERESGTIRLLLSLPLDRIEIVLGKLLGRLALVSVTAIVGAAVGYLSLLLFGGSVSGIAYASVIGLALLLQATFVAISIGLSAGFRSERVVVAAGLGSVVLFTTLWRVVARAIEGGFSAIGLESAGQSITQLVFGINPVLAFSRLSSLAIGEEVPIDSLWGEWWVAILVLCCWFLIPLVVGVRRFETAEIG